jgi:hypothetical protein
MPVTNPPNATFPSIRWRLSGIQLGLKILSHMVAASRNSCGEIPSALGGVFMNEVGPSITNIVIIHMIFKSTPRAM